MNYSQMSKEIGWEEQSITLPTEEELDNIIEKAENGCSNSFKRIFTINRFAVSNKETRDRINKNYDAYIRLKDKF